MGSRSRAHVVAQYPSGTPDDEPNKAQKAIGEFLKDKPFLQDLFGYLGQPLSAIANVAEAGVLGLQGEGSKALAKLASAGKNIGDVLTPGFADITGPDDMNSLGNVLKTAGVPKLGEVDLPLIGKVTGRGALGFGLDIAADPLMYTKIGQLTRAGREAQKAGTLARGGATEAGAILGARAAQAQAGQRALLQMFGVPVIKGERAIAGMESWGRHLKGSVLTTPSGAPLVSKSAGFPQMLDDLNAHLRLANLDEIKAGSRGAKLLTQATEIAESRGLSADAAFKEALDQIHAATAGVPRHAIRGARMLAEEQRRVLLERASAISERVRTTTSQPEIALESRALRIITAMQKDSAEAASLADKLLDNIDAAMSNKPEAARLAKVADALLGESLRADNAAYAVAARTRDAGFAVGAKSAAHLDAQIRMLRRFAVLSKGDRGKAYARIASMLSGTRYRTGEIASMAEGAGIDFANELAGILKPSVASRAATTAEDVLGASERIGGGEAIAPSAVNPLLSRAQNILSQSKARVGRLEKIASSMIDRASAFREKRYAPVRALEKEAAALGEANPFGGQQLPGTLDIDSASGRLVRERPEKLYDLIEEYKKRGFSPREAIAGARAHFTTGVDRDFAPIGQAMVRDMLRMGRAEIQAGGLLQTLNDKALWYVTRYATDDALELMRKSPGLGERISKRINGWFARHDSMKHRNDFFEGKPINEVNEAVRHEIEATQGIELSDKFKFFEDDISKLLPLRQARANKVITIGETMADALRAYAKPASRKLEDLGFIPAEKVLARHNLQASRDLAFAKDMVMHPDAARALDQILTNIKDPAAARGLLGLYDKVTGLWKSAVVAWPESIARNSLTDLYANFIMGVKSPRSYAMSIRAMLGDPASIVVKSADPAIRTVEDVMTQMRAGGALEQMGRVSEMGVEAAAKAPASTLGKIGRIAAAPIAVPFRGLRHAAEFQSKMFRLAHVIEKLEQGLPIDDAIRSSKLALFDYRGGLTPFEKTVMRRVIPFYCVPDDAQILTKDGWKGPDSLVVGEAVLTYESDRDAFAWGTATGLNIFAHNEPLMTFANSRYKMRFTHGHRWPVRLHETTIKHSYGTYTYKNRRSVVLGHQLNKYHSFIMAAKLDEKESVLTPEQARLVGWLLTDGYFRWRGKHCEALIYQSPKKFLQEVIEVAGGKPRKPHPVTGVIAVPVLKERVKPISQYLNKDAFPALVTRLSTEAAEAMYDAMYKAEGTTSTLRKADHFAQNPGGVLEGFRILALILGKRTNARTSGCGCYVSNRRFMQVAAGTLGEEHYSGRVWCPTTSNGTWVMRQGNTICVTGNSWVRFNTPFMVQTILGQPGKVALVGHLQRALRGGLTDAGPMDTTDVPDWMQRRFLGLKKDDDGKVSTFMGLGIGLEDLAMFDQAPTELLASMNPLIKATVQAITEKDLWSGKPWDRGAVAPWYFKHFGEPFRNLIGFKPVVDKDGDESWYRADPFWMNILSALPSSRAMSTMSRFDFGKDDASMGAPLLKTFTGFRVGETNVASLHARATMEAMDAYLKERIAKGDVVKPSAFSVPRVAGNATPEEIAAQAEMRRLLKARSRLVEALRTNAEKESPTALRSGTGQ